MKTFSVGCKVGLLIWVHILLADCSGAFAYARLVHVGGENHRANKSLKSSSRSCATACALNVECASFSYDLQTRICVLRNITPGNNDMVYAKVPGNCVRGFECQDQIHLVFGLYPAIELTHGAHEECKCHRNGCSLGFGFRCQAFRRFHPYVSESRVCGNQTYVTGARKHVLNGATTYTCEHPDFKACLNKTISVCQCTGTWDNWTGMCGRFRWKNQVIKNQALFLPCHSWEEFSVTIRLTLQNDSRFDIYLLKGTDMVFYAYFRFQFNKQSHNIFCNTFVQNIWGRGQEWQSPTLHFGRECIVKIILSRGVYSLDVDGERRCTIPERVKGIEPEYVEIENDVTVNSVEIAV